MGNRVKCCSYTDARHWYVTISSLMLYVKQGSPVDIAHNHFKSLRSNMLTRVSCNRSAWLVKLIVGAETAAGDENDAAGEQAWHVVAMFRLLVIVNRANEPKTFSVDHPMSVLHS